MARRKRKSKKSKENFKEFMDDFLQDVLVGTFGGFIFYILNAFANLSTDPVNLGFLMILAIGFIAIWSFFLGYILWWFRNRK